VPPGDVERLTAIVAPQGRGPGIIEQRALARFIDGGHFDRHLRRLRQRLIARQSALIDGLERLAGGRLAGAPVQAGRHLVVRVLDRDVDPAAVVERAAAAGVRVGTVGSSVPAGVAARGADRDRLLIGFGGAEPAEIVEGIRRLVRAIDAARSIRPAGPTTSWGWTPASGRDVVAGPHGDRRHEP
jgi:GntR family transcriptional regulator/MocR family aminotransferase